MSLCQLSTCSLKGIKHVNKLITIYYTLHKACHMQAIIECLTNASMPASYSGMNEVDVHNLHVLKAPLLYQ